MDEKIKDYVLDLVARTRQPGNNGLADLNTLIAFGASPRASINMILASRAHAFLQGRGFVTPEDIKSIAPDVLRHRIITTYEAEGREHHQRPHRAPHSGLHTGTVTQQDSLTALAGLLTEPAPASSSN